jgi:asparagine synthase (glutamine-hydrolysing)
VFNKRQTELRKPEDYVNHSLYLEAKTFMHGLLVVEDKMSMAHSLETRVPFLDNDLVDFAMKVPAHLKLGQLTEVSQLNENDLETKMGRYQRASDGKIILRNMMKKLIPESITQREKQGFSAPDASWFKGESMEYVRSRLFNPHARIYDYMDRGTVQALVSDHLEGRQNRRLLLWSLLNVEQWCEEFLGRSHFGSEARA